MPIFRKEKNELYYVHIPRTSGRYIKELFLFNDYEVEFDDTFEDIKSSIKTAPGNKRIP